MQYRTIVSKHRVKILIAVCYSLLVACVVVGVAVKLTCGDDTVVFVLFLVLLVVCVCVVCVVTLYVSTALKKHRKNRR